MPSVSISTLAAELSVELLPEKMLRRQTPEQYRSEVVLVRDVRRLHLASSEYHHLVPSSL